MQALLVDDNRIARSILIHMASDLKDLEIVCECSNALEAYQYMMEHPVDVLLLDIEMPGMNGLELTRNLGEKSPLIIFTTFRKEYAVEAFELNVVDYLVKPITLPRFTQAIDKARDILESQKEQIQWASDEFIFVRDSNIVRRLQLKNILYAEAMGDYVKLHTPEKMYAIHTTMRAVENRFPAEQFLRVHRSYIVNLSSIDTFQDGGLYIGKKFIPVTDSYRKQVNSRLNVL
ncbi:DNA-binding response regulator, LytR/AlgR family [Catalinimonas alkaloidigena]|uniref:DNA-binding response regulator, LytR/AlgR family n=1 Tax=Catalinimonas alkaloidigena TaxID=1075417 RepID=A0A1G9P5I2_9BACT|nr:LytTR family DNA-binding domain-containing protein [Catalinimonas alkaloidigena]SDL94078.1 DNA-binding response regulator, LytR/AlgR family [Catalinimonas alkaloidigena]